MAITNHERVGKALDLLKAGLAPFIERELKRAIQNSFTAAWTSIRRAPAGMPGASLTKSLHISLDLLDRPSR